MKECDNNSCAGGDETCRVCRRTFHVCGFSMVLGYGRSDVCKECIKQIKKKLKIKKAIEVLNKVHKREVRING